MNHTKKEGPANKSNNNNNKTVGGQTLYIHNYHLTSPHAITLMEVHPELTQNIEYDIKAVGLGVF